MSPIRSAIGAVILAAGLVVSASLISKLFVRVKQESAISVKGYAEQGVRADAGTFTVTVGARGTSAREAMELLTQRRERVREALRAQAFNETETRLQPLSQRKVLRKDSQGRDSNEIEFFDLNQSIVVNSTNVNKIYNAAIALPDLMNEEIDLTVTSPEFLISDMESLKRKLLAKATEDGYQRAIVMARHSGGRVGELVSAQQGVFQITTPLSTETSSWGIYDTSTIEKSAKVVVTLEYAILPGAR